MRILPLSVLLTIPLDTQTLKRARQIKNARLERMVEMFPGEDTGSGLMARLNFSCPIRFRAWT
tara:strand:+ start:333 stop:521 length:189 start_codon:yes stop_codon:yes gene_type:complete